VIKINMEGMRANFTFKLRSFFAVIDVDIIFISFAIRA